MGINNMIRVSGKLGDIKYSHRSGGKDYYKAELSSRTETGNMDSLVLVGRESIFRGLEGKFVMADGRIRTFSPEINGKSRLFVEIWPDTITETGDFGEDINLTEIKGIVLRDAWHMDFGSRSLSTFLLIAREGYSTWCIPCCAWNRTTRYARNLEAGSLVWVSGELHTREFEYYGETRTATGITVHGMEILVRANPGQLLKAVS